MKKIILFCRSLIFSILFCLSSIILFTILILPIIFDNQTICTKIGRIWAATIVFLLKVLCGVNYKVVGLENLPRNGTKYIIASKHESTWETYFLFYFFRKDVSFILKKELLKIPFFGWSLKHTGQIAIDREAKGTSIKQVVKEANEALNNKNREIIIFPQGTRVPVDSSMEEYPYKIGFFAIIKALKADIVPIALNTGCFWPKGKFIKTPGEVTLKILPIIKYEEIANLSKVQAVEYLAKTIETESKLLAERQ